ncbi:hypothetical protein TNCV_4428711 [Trichonephila clavipes]|nr:hypothetical protein TNCV_4428711 [Trichonephila clavipes]
MASGLVPPSYPNSGHEFVTMTTRLPWAIISWHSMGKELVPAHVSPNILTPVQNLEALSVVRVPVVVLAEAQGPCVGMVWSFGERILNKSSTPRKIQGQHTRDIPKEVLKDNTPKLSADGPIQIQSHETVL